MLDGRHTGTGGGNHIVIGGPTPADSPFLRRPDLLRSLVGYWHNHPSLSYLFSGLFIGPTSQHPRVDEGAQRLRSTSWRSRSRRFPIGEQPAALAGRSGLPQPARSTSPATRTAPSSASTSSTRPRRSSGRLGLVELRAFEMPPHARMSLDAAAAAARADRAVLERAVRSAARALGHGAARPLHAAAFRRAGLRRRGRRSATQQATRFEPEWFAPHFEFRFPLYRRVDAARRAPRTAAGARAVARAGRRAGARRHGALRRFVGRAAAGEGQRADRLAARRDVQRPARAAASDRDGRRIRRRRALPRLAAAELPASDDSACTRRSCSTWWTLEPAVARRLRLSRRASRAAELRDVPGQRLRGGRAGASRDSSPSATRRVRCTMPPEERNPDFPLTLDLRRPTVATG